MMIQPGWRYALKFSGEWFGLAIWVPWRHPSQPLIYAFWRRVF